MLGSTTSSKRGGSGLSLTSPSQSQRETGGRGGGSELDEAQIEDENAARVLKEIDQLASDRVFSSSVSLSDQALQEFVVQLTVVSLSECSGVGPSGAIGGSLPRVFSLQKLVEVADMNMRTRSRMVWAATWQTLSRHFTTVGCHEDLTVGMYAIDSLRQLSVKFLERAELRDFNFQRLFLAPFRTAETYAPGSENRVVLLGFQIARGVLERHFDCIVDVFVDAVECLLAFAVCGCEEVEHQMEEQISLTQLGIDSIGLLRSVCIEKLATGEVIEPLAARETARSFLAASASAAKQTIRVGAAPEAESMRSLEREMAKLSSPKVLTSAAASLPTYQGADAVAAEEPEYLVSSETVYNDSAAHMRVWWPVLSALYTLAADRRLDVRLAAQEALFDALETHGTKFSSSLWMVIFKDVLIPLLDELRHLEVVVNKGAHMSPKLTLPPTLNLSSRMPHYSAGKTTATLCLERLLECFGLFYDIVGFLPDVLFLLGKCMDADADEQLAAASPRALEVMLVTYGHKISEGVWGLIIDELRNVMKRAEPTWIFFALPRENVTEPHIDSVDQSPPKLNAVPASDLMSPQQPSLLGMYPGVVAILGFTFVASFPPKVPAEYRYAHI
ncbi:unnamed protein product [Peronospora belbahrii]|uniref:Mon2 C-terminal domain-containing protein n=1 Tax=Peronospora belbahrii TaxID=622444 RepID=A0ABN8D467_9STRA|nr:unnamed protein product [Peronospora belbahrii]